jgi:hypothetical protein
MSHDPAALSAGAVALSTSAITAALVFRLRRLGILDEQGEREIYEHALLMLEEGQGDDDSGVFDAARELIEQQLRPGRLT